jgi:hypothetical protein
MVEDALPGRFRASARDAFDFVLAHRPVLENEKAQDERGEEYREANRIKEFSAELSGKLFKLHDYSIGRSALILNGLR